MYRDDNAKVYYLLEEATRSTAYAASIKPLQRAKDGRGAWRALVTQYAGEDMWRALVKSSEEVMHNRKWRGNNNIALEQFVGQHRNAFVTLSQCAEHLLYQLPNESTRVAYLMDNIECSDAPLQAAMALVHNANGPTGRCTTLRPLPHSCYHMTRLQRKDRIKSNHRLRFLLLRLQLPVSYGWERLGCNCTSTPRQSTELLPKNSGKN